MKVMSVSEFDAWQKASGERVFILDTDNNEWHPAQPFHICLRFPKVIVSAFLDRIAFRDGNTILCLDRVKEVHMYDTYEMVGTVFDVICCPTVGNPMTWRFLAD